MSEPIQSISQGNYILQGTVATSAGIVGDGSTQNPIRADETVLWEAPGGITGRTSACTVSESLKNFEHVDVWLAHSTYGPTRAGSFDFNVMGNTGYFSVMRPRGQGNLNVAFMYITASDTTLTCTQSKCLMFGAYNSTSTSVTATLNDAEDRNCIYKVVGINRIANN